MLRLKCSISSVFHISDMLFVKKNFPFLYAVCIWLHYKYVIVFCKTDHVVTNTEIPFLPVDESHTHALSRDTKHLSLDGQVCFCRQLFSDAAKP